MKSRYACVNKWLLIILFYGLSVTTLFANQATQQLYQLAASHQFVAGQLADGVDYQPVLNSSRAFIARHGESSIASMRGGRDFLAHHKRLEAFDHIKNQLADCGEDRRRLSERLQSAAASVDICNLRYTQSDVSVNRLVNLWEGIQSQHEGLSMLAQRKVYEQAVLASASTLWEYERLLGDIKSDHVRVENFCPNNSCDQGMRHKLIEQLAQQKITEANHPAPARTQLVQSLNTNLTGLNRQLAAVPIKVDPGYIRTTLWDSSDPEFTQESMIHHSLYHETYVRLASHGVGTLLLTDHLQEKVGSLRGLEDVEERTRAQTSYRYEPHQPVRENDLLQAYREVRGKVSEQVATLHEEYKDNVSDHDDRREQLKDMLRTHPVAAGRALMENPAQASLFCTLTKEIEDEDRRRGTIKKVALWGGIIVGGAAALTGIGAGVGAALIGSSAAGLATLGTVSLAVGLGVGVAETGYYASEAYRANQDYRDFQFAVLSGTSDREGVAEARQALRDNSEATTNAIIAGVFTLADVSALRALSHTGAGAAALRQMNQSMANMVRRAAANPKLSRLFASINREGREQGIIARLLMPLSRMDAGVQNRFLDKLADMPTDEAEQLIRKVGQCGR